MAYTSISFEQIANAALKATSVLALNGYESCLSGPLACAMYGRGIAMPNPYVCTLCENVGLVVQCGVYSLLSPPQRVDIVVLSGQHNSDQLRELLSKDEAFFIAITKQPQSIRENLYCRGPDSVAVRVVILTPGLIGLSSPVIPVGQMNHATVNGQRLSALPAIPLLFLLLQTWDKHRKAEWPETKCKQDLDIRFINALAKAAADRGNHRRECDWVPSGLIDEGRRLFREFARQSLVEDLRDWNSIGFSRFEYY
ncbi:hypothetical protein NLI96_g12112 [Meripilus lineatus]|uniref:Uncharacterized protein n=1 Tax=Meripilus lineatus TaxID=2056292 RepID=A0AAD5UQP6_9APHY|nr:hypothetical protein NLI96_g12112 [Physisporinus lineatus]